LYNFLFLSYTKKVFGVSQVSFTNQPKGSQFKLKRVHLLSMKIFLARGGIHNPNSSTLTQNFLAAVKCHNS